MDEERTTLTDEEIQTAGAEDEGWPSPAGDADADDQDADDQDADADDADQDADADDPGL